MARLLRRRRRCGARGAAAPHHATPGAQPAGHIPFTPRAKKSLEHSLREAKARHDNYIGVEHLMLALVGRNDGAVPPILSALGTTQATLRAAILDRYRRAS
jgi:ATP-dependent Clp protease ATP-binding subunit ClpA